MVSQSYDAIRHGVTMRPPAAGSRQKVTPSMWVVNCTCPYKPKPGELCKHAGGVLLALRDAVKPKKVIFEEKGLNPEVIQDLKRRAERNSQERQRRSTSREPERPKVDSLPIPARTIQPPVPEGLGTMVQLMGAKGAQGGGRTPRVRGEEQCDLARLHVRLAGISRSSRGCREPARGG